MNKEIYTEIFSNILDEYNVKIDYSLIESIANDYAEAIIVQKEIECEQFRNPDKKSDFQMVSELKRKLERLERKLKESNRFKDGLSNYLKRKYNTEYVSVDNYGNVLIGQ